MKRFGVLLLVIAFLSLWMSPAGVLAQRGDSDGDGVPDSADRCPKVPGPASNNGCPVATTNNGTTAQEPPLHPPGDSDGDGTLDVNDKCPQDGGPDWNNGCPTDLTAPPQPTSQSVLPTMPTSGPCVIATIGQGRVNLRAGHGFHLGVSRDVIEMRVAGKDDAHVFQLVSQRLDVGAHQRRGFGHCGIEQDITGR